VNPKNDISRKATTPERNVRRIQEKVNIATYLSKEKGGTIPLSVRKENGGEEGRWS